ncbi:prominin-1-A-like isoform X3 [Tachypleus tridentatus]|uniref:prominin-1-A-like isoform X3 n=1 Tax=Tachypleus tridentatus TaxID=6853 RepID=UPI003FD4DA82
MALWLVPALYLLLIWHDSVLANSEYFLPEDQNSTVKVLFSRAPLLNKYRVSSDFDPKGMEHLYTVTSFFLQLIQSPGLPPEILTDELVDDPVGVLNEHRGVILSHFLGMLLMGLIGLLLGVVIPLGGFFFCCCRCAGRCGGSRMEVMEKKRDSCRRISYGIVMFSIVVVMLFGLVCAFVTNEYIEQGVQALPDNVKLSIDDVQLYFNNTKSEVNNLLKNNFKQLQEKLEESLDRSGYIVKVRLGEVSQAVAVDNLTEIVSRLEQLRNDINEAMENTKKLQQDGNQLQLGLAGVRKDLMGLLNECNTEACQEILKQYDLSYLVVEPNFSELPNLTDVMQKLSDLLHEDIESEVRKGKDTFDRLSYTIQDAVSNAIPAIKQKIRNFGIELGAAADNTSQMLHVPELRQAKEVVSSFQPYIEKYSVYRRYGSMALCCGMLAIVLCFTFGVVCGSCGSRPGNIYGDSSCNKGVGARLLIMGVIVVFLLSFFLLLTTTALFLVGGATQRTICDVIKNTSDPQMKEVILLVQKRLLIKVIEEDFQITEILRQCHNNKSLYQTLELEKRSQLHIGPNVVVSIFNLSQLTNYRERYKVDEKLSDFLNQLNVNPNVTLLTTEGKELLKQLKDTPVSSINFTVYFVMAEEQLTAINLLELAAKLNNTAEILPSSQLELAAKLRNSALQLESYHLRLVISIRSSLNKLRNVAEHIQKASKFYGKKLKDVIIELLEKAQWAQEFIQTKGKEELKKLGKEFVSEFTKLIDQYAAHVKQQVTEEIGRCGPVSQAYNASYVAACNKVILPFNGFWASLGWCTLLCIPCIFIAVTLSVLYRRIDPYPGPLVDSDFASDNYADRDNIPLAKY